MSQEQPLDQTSRQLRRRAMVSMPFKAHSPLVELGRRALLALVLMGISTVIVYVDRGSYIDNVTHQPITFIDALYYSTVTVTTTGYGDITPLTPWARLISAIVVTPLRIGFLVLLVGATLEVLANEGRRGLRDASWRRHMRNHTVVIGYGTKGRSAIATLLNHDLPSDRIVVIDAKGTAVAEANRHGLAAFEGDATRRDLLRRAEVAKAREVIITLPRDDTAILTTLTVRQLNARCHIVVAGREEENLPLLRESGANAVVTSADAVGRLLGLTTVNPHVGEVVDDLISSAHGMEVIQRMVSANEVGARPSDIVNERVLAVVRNGTLRNFYDPTLDKLKAGDSVIVVRRALTRHRATPQPPHS
ncbi:potassium channel family protein [Acidipropionibacterium jensenii]|uniref:potassium channel family protein n=1 Tax=Acidipropionibacterium jensenii TaxID=1749 RepID=UPI00110A3445|nr:potassium channel family protein [Acidipropionibacterium jensenii]MDN5977484.1 potassium channel family protein [Acidipropionibacterium jensenii]MDN5995660.1 potassium channel family protein [Acidipropionibacterium jensenii]MDN6427236.1 potassium channel family protein [Acidipropionibacterium jensenii]MDN6441940.1 potassium channel family protein [Acidipropionibacterium jensenii]MDN6480561.1 potassium channel family protein [Acidipropionibacterium jensenii]